MTLMSKRGILSRVRNCDRNSSSSCNIFRFATKKFTMKLMRTIIHSSSQSAVFIHEIHVLTSHKKLVLIEMMCWRSANSNIFMTFCALLRVPEEIAPRKLPSDLRNFCPYKFMVTQGNLMRFTVPNNCQYRQK